MIQPRPWSRTLSASPEAWLLEGASNLPIYVLFNLSTRGGGAEEDRTPDLCSAIAALSHLSYSPTPSDERPNSRAFALAQRPIHPRFQLVAALARRAFCFAGNGPKRSPTL